MTEEKSDGNAESGIHEPTLSADQSLRSERDLLALYVGRNQSKFLKAYDGSRIKGIRNTRARLKYIQINWVVLFFSFPWLFYRKRYLEGAGIILVPVIFGFLFPDLLGTVQISIGGILAAVGNLYYVERAVSKIKKIEALPLPEAERDERIRRAGGVSVAGAIMGAIIYLGVVGAALYSIGNDVPPKCDAENVQSTVRELMIDRVKSSGSSAGSGVFADFSQIAKETRNLRSCKYSLLLEEQSMMLLFDIKREDKKDGKFEVILKGEAKN